MAPVTKQLEDFLASDGRTCWLADDSIRVYARKGLHVLDGKPRRTLDFSAAAVLPEPFHELLDFARRVNPFEAVYLDNVEPDLVAGLLGSGWQADMAAPYYFWKWADSVENGARKMSCTRAF